MMLLPSTSVAESSSVEERIQYEEVLSTISEENHVTRDDPYEPTLILRLLLIIRNILLIGIIGIVGIIFTLMNLINNNSSA